MAEVRYQHVTKIYGGTKQRAVDNLDLAIADAELMVLVGPSGSGKSTALRMLAGLEGVDEGRISIGNRDVTNEHPSARDIAMVFQNYALYPHMTVSENVGFHLRVAHVNRREIGERVGNAARILGLEDYLERKPALLSGGQRQRVAMGRAIVRQPKVFLMDEPLSNLDAKLRGQMRVEIAALQRRLGTTMVYVTHDQVEAMTMGDRIAILDNGILQQCDTPRRVYERPRNVFVAGFIGSPPMNLLTVPVSGDRAQLGSMSIALSRAERSGLKDAKVTLGVRAESLEVTSTEEGVQAMVEFVEELGSDRYVHVAVPGHVSEPVIIRDTHAVGPTVGRLIGIRFERDHLHVFDAVSGERVGD